MNNNTKTPQNNRLHVGIFGETNAGKSSLFNALTEADNSIVSDIPGTTTDFVQKAMELTPFGPIVLIDTAGLGDETALGQKRMEKTYKLLDRIDFAIYVVDGSDMRAEFAAQLDKRQIPHMVVAKTETVTKVKQTLICHLSKIKKDLETLLGGLLPPGATVLMVTPIDSAAPKGRLILPQSQLIRDCLDNGFISCVVTEKELPQALQNLKKIDLAVTDSQVFGLVNQLLPPDIMLTSFSILMARQKGNIETLLDGLKAVSRLKDTDKILISEVCTHNRTHEDIGRVKIPAALGKITGRTLSFDFTTGHDFPEISELSQYALIIHCGACMITPREMKSRIATAQEADVPITNYGLFLAHASGILDRSIEILDRRHQ